MWPKNEAGLDNHFPRLVLTVGAAVWAHVCTTDNTPSMEKATMCTQLISKVLLLECQIV
jgi:hypothetical protein